MRLCYSCSSGGTSTRGLSPSAVNGRDDQQQKEMKRVRKAEKEKEREREYARVILVLRMFQVR